jgi:nitroimidazol reductase NimA-like FMN-containing flavoprotein (pyridoxamine 5'-phosphate oxidase superfamily)
MRSRSYRFAGPEAPLLVCLISGNWSFSTYRQPGKIPGMERPAFPVSRHNRVRRKPERASYDRALAYSILDQALYCSVGFVSEGRPFVIPMAFGRWGDELVLHGASKARIAMLGAGAPLCITVTLLDGIVFARSAMHHSMNYRSVVVLGEARELREPADKLEALRCVIEHVQPGRWRATREPNELELRATGVLCVPIEEASVKCRSGGPLDDAEDLELPYWAGVVPLSLVSGTPVSDARHAPNTGVPDGLDSYRRPPTAAVAEDH